MFRGFGQGGGVEEEWGEVVREGAEGGEEAAEAVELKES